MPGSSLASSARGSEVRRSRRCRRLDQEGLGLGADRRWRHRLAAAGLQRMCEMRPTCQSCTTILPPACVHRVGHLLPAVELLGRVEAGHVGIALALVVMAVASVIDQAGAWRAGA